MPARDATAEALWKILYGQATVGYAVVGVRRVNGGGGVHWERHGLNVARPKMWTKPVAMLVEKDLRAEVWPFVAGASVLRGIGTSAYQPGRGGSWLRPVQALVAVVWGEAPATDGLTRFVGVGGHVVASSVEGEHFGLVPLDAARPWVEVVALTARVAEAVGATPLGVERALPIPGVNKAMWVTDPARALAGTGVSADALLSGLRATT